MAICSMGLEMTNRLLDCQSDESVTRLSADELVTQLSGDGQSARTASMALNSWERALGPCCYSQDWELWILLEPDFGISSLVGVV